MPITKEIWTDVILEAPIQSDDFLSESVDMSDLVEYNIIHLAEAGVEPQVFIDNKTYPVGTVQREDVPKELPLQTLDTENTLVRNIEAMELSYDKVKSVTRGHKNALTRKRRALAAYNWCPLKDTDKTPVLEASGAPDANGRKRLTFADLDRMKSRFVAMECDLENLVIALNPEHEADLQAENRALYREYLKDKKIGVFRTYLYPHLPLFDTTTKQKQAFGSAAGENSRMASVVWQKNEVMRAVGNTDVFSTTKDPGSRGDIIGFQQRFIALPMRNKYIGAII